MEQNNKNSMDSKENETVETIDIQAQLIKAVGDDTGGREVYASIQAATLSILGTINLDSLFPSRKKLIETEISLVVSKAIGVCHLSHLKQINKAKQGISE